MYSGIDAIVVAIDCSSRMYETGSIDSDSFLAGSLQAALEIMQRKVICSESDMISVLLFGTSASQNALGQEHIFVLYLFSKSF